MGEISSNTDRIMTQDELLNLPVSVDITTAGRAFGMGRTKAQELARRGEFPCRILRIGASYRVPRADLLRALGVEDSVQSAGERTAASL